MSDIRVIPDDGAPWEWLLVDALVAVVFDGAYDDSAVEIAVSHPFCSSAIQAEIRKMGEAL